MSTAIVWFRRDLRLVDNPALTQASLDHDVIVPVYIFAPHEEAPWEPGGASRWWLHHSLESLDRALQGYGSRLIIRAGDSLATLKRLLVETGAHGVYWNRLYDPALVARDKGVKSALQVQGIHAWSGNAALLFEPWTVATGAEKPYRVFTPFWRTCRARLGEPRMTQAPVSMATMGRRVGGDTLTDLELLPRTPWYRDFGKTWQPGEAGALERMERFSAGAMVGYSGGRDFPARASTSGLSPHLHFGEVGPRQLATAALAEVRGDLGKSEEAEKFISELGWREFAHHLLFHFPETVDTALNGRFAAFPWRDDWQADYGRWCRGNTGIPMVDAGMRELWNRGWMHNRVRMVVGSLLTKNLQIAWQLGARWFWDTLVDADLANNTLGWQWISGCGADAAPYYRIFNPVRQGEKFDTHGEYVRQWVPEIAALPDKHLHAPWEAPPAVLRDAAVRLGDTYPEPVVDLKLSRRVALSAYDQIMGRV